MPKAAKRYSKNCEAILEVVAQIFSCYNHTMSTIPILQPSPQPPVGQVRFNTDYSLFEVYSPTGQWILVDHSGKAICHSAWKPWWAWRPVKVHSRWAWLRQVYRRRLNDYVDYDDWSRYEYGTIFDVLKDT
jgi:hypothetical protein